MQLSGYIVRTTALARLGSGDASAVESLANDHEEGLRAIERRRQLADGSADDALRSWVMEGRAGGRAAAPVLELLVTDAPRDHLLDDAWSPVRAGTFEDLDAALQKAGLARNTSVRRLARPAGGAANRALTLDDGLLWVLAGHDYFKVETLWPAAIQRLPGDEAARASALLGWWHKTLERHTEAAVRGQHAQFDVLLVLA